MQDQYTARLQAQLALEQESIDEGVAKYRKAMEDGAADLPPGQQLLRAAMAPLIEAIKTWKKETSAGLASRSAGVYYFIDQIPEETLAYVTAQTCISMLHTRPNVTKVASALCLTLEGTRTLEAMLDKAPALAEKVKKAVSRMNAERNKLVFIRKGAGMADTKVIQWDAKTRVRVGALLVGMFAESTGLIALDTLPIGHGKTSMLVRATESCTRWLEEAHARCALLSPTYLPMVCQPRDWTNPFNGGYLRKEMRRPLVKTRNRNLLDALRHHDMPWVYAAVNALQATEWSVNTAVYATVKALWEANADTPALPARERLEVPVKPWGESDNPDPAVLHAWKVDAAKTHDHNARSESKRQQVVQKLWVAEKMQEHGNVFHYVYGLDWRGRMYPVANSLTPQGDDVSKALLQFGRAVPLGENGAYWLAIQGANTFGVDKVSFEERIDWVQRNTDAILECARSPLSSRFWEDADAPFCFLAFCFEWARLQAWVDAGADVEQFESRLPVAFDGACNGLQNFSAMLLDEVGGKATGLVPGEKPSDIYSEVARAAQALIDKEADEGHEVAGRWVGKMTRKLAKRNTMTVPYGVTQSGMRGQLFQELKDSPAAQRAEDAAYLAGKNYEAIGSVVVAARTAMDWLRAASKVASSTGLPVRWTTPSGFLAVQDYRDPIGEALDFTVLGRRMQLILERQGDKLNPRKQSLGISPNFVHSLDAAHLMRTVLFCAQDGVKDFAMIHDSYGTHAGHAGLLRNNLRQAFVEQYSEPVLENFRQELLAQLPPEQHDEVPPLPAMGTLDLQQVLQSEYFFA